MSQTRPDVSVLIKAYNEGCKIDAAIASVWAARHEIAPLQMEIIVADGLSQDDTARRALQWCRHAPVRVVQLLQAEHRGCGSGVELGYAWSQGDWLLLMDADMTLQPHFLTTALAHLHDHTGLGGVGGLIEDPMLRNATDRIRQCNRLGARIGLRPWLEGGGLYRRQAIRQAGDDAGPYAGDMRLQAFEEADLGLRLHRAGWSLARLPVPAMHHNGHAVGTMQLLMRRWRSGRMAAAGRLMRLHLGRPGGMRVVRLFAQPLALAGLWGLGGGLGLWLPSADQPRVLASGAVLAVVGTGIQVLRKRSLHHVLAAVVDWHLVLAGIAVGAAQALPRRWAPLPSRCLRLTP